MVVAKTSQFSLSMCSFQTFKDLDMFESEWLVQFLIQSMWTKESSSDLFLFWLELP